jgi:hypothetical protein
MANFQNITDTVTTGAVSLTGITLAPQLAAVTADVAQVPVQDTITVIMQVIMSLATLYKLFFHKPKDKNTDDNV